MPDFQGFSEELTLPVEDATLLEQYPVDELILDDVVSAPVLEDLIFQTMAGDASVLDESTPVADNSAPTNSELPAANLAELPAIREMPAETLVQHWQGLSAIRGQMRWLPVLQPDYGNLATAQSLLGTDASDQLMGTDASNLIAGGLGDDVVRAGGGNDQIVGSTGLNVGRNQFFGEAGNDWLTLGGSRGLADGGTGNDVLLVVGGALNVLQGKAGNDWLDGGATGKQTLAGGAGKDCFVLHKGSGSVVVADFAKGDRLYVSGVANKWAGIDLVQKGSDTLVMAGKDLLARLSDVNQSSIQSATFV